MPRRARPWLRAAMLLPLALGLAFGRAWAGPAGPAADSIASIQDLLKRQRGPEAEARVRRWLVEIENGRNDTLRAAALDLLVDCYRANGEWNATGARDTAERAVAFKVSLYGPEHVEVAASLSNLASLLYRAGEWRLARPPAERALAILDRAYAGRHRAIVRSLHTLGNVLEDGAEFAGAERLYQRELALASELYGPESIEAANALNSTAILYRKTGRFSESKPLYERSLAIREKVRGPDHDDVAWSLNNFANLLVDMGDVTAARPMYERALAVHERALGAEHPGVALGLNNLANCEAALGDTARALAHYQRSLAIREKVLGPDHPDVGQSCLNLGLLWTGTGDSAKAQAAIDRALAIRERAYGKDHPQTAQAIFTLARLRLTLGDGAHAAALYERALAIREQAFGPANRDVAETLAELAAALHAAGRDSAAFETALRAEDAAAGHLRLTARVLEERVALEYAATRASGLGLALDILATAPDAPGRGTRAFDTLVRSRALVLDEMAERHRVVGASGDPDLARLDDSLRASREHIARLIARGPASGTADYRAQIEEAQRAKDRAEAALAEHSADFRRERAVSAAGLTEVRSGLPPGSALVAYARYQPPGGGARPAREPAYIAFVVLPGIDPVAVPLGPAGAIERRAALWIAAVSRAPSPLGRARAERECRALGESMRAAIWDPIAPRLADAERIFVVCDGALHRVSFAALPARGGGYLVEGPPLQLLSTERDLAAPRATRRDSAGVLVLGAPEYDERTSLWDRSLASPSFASEQAPQADSAATAGSRVAYRGATSRCGEFESLRFEPLPAARREVDDVAALWSGARGPRSGGVVRLTGAGATETAFKRLAPGRRILHLATHGFFLRADCDTARAGRGNGPAAPAPTALESPLLRSGLALAGANRRGDASARGARDDGVLTAEEIASLDLSGVEWAVLSACETGRGDIAASEGVLGLRRAFQVAGARTVVMSLWAVDDLSTRQWMHALYQARLERGLDSAAAVRAASLATLRALRAAGRGTHPFYWAGFVAAGDWR